VVSTGSAESAQSGRHSLVQLVPDDLPAVLELCGREPFLGALVRSLVTRYGLAPGGPIRFWGMVGPSAGPGTSVGRHLAGLVTLDKAGRSTIVGGGSAWAEPTALMLAQESAGATPLSFVDAPPAMAGPLETLMVPWASEQLSILVWDAAAAGDTGAGKERHKGHDALIVRPLEQADGPAMNALYALDHGLGPVDSADLWARHAQGSLLVMVGVTAARQELVTAAWGSLGEGDATRIAGVLTHPAHRNRGYGRAVVSALTTQLVGLGRRPFLYVARDNAPAVAIYRSIGYRPHAQVVKLKFTGK